MKKYLLILIGITFLLSEIMLKLNPSIAFMLYSLLIGGCLIALSNEESLTNHGKLIIIFMILPIVRISELFLNFSFIINSFAVYAILLFLVIFYSVKFKINPGFKSQYLILLPVVIILGIALGSFSNYLFSFTKDVRFIVLLPLIAVSEEILFRGLIQNMIQKEYNQVTSVVFTSLLYGIFGLGFGLPFALFLFACSLIMSLIYSLTKNIYLTITMSLILHLFIIIV